jgi:fructan beta-fructosidase
MLSLGYGPGATWETMAADTEADVMVAAFEGDSWGSWTVEGEAFGTRPAGGALPGQQPVKGFAGKGYANSYVGGDESTGRLISPLFRIERPFINLLVGGGNKPGSASVNLLVNGKVERSATGGDAELLEPIAWDVAEFVGSEARIEIVDSIGGGWGHINVDHIVQSMRRAASAVGPASRMIDVSARYLYLPVRTGAPMKRMRVAVGDVLVDEFDIELAPDRPEFEVFVDLQPHRGKTATVEIDRWSLDAAALDWLALHDRVPGGDDIYRESLRPQFHFTSRRGWLNDPNGLVVYEGKWHLFYQHNPYGRNWGNMHWGHAVATDLVHWEELPIALFPHRYGDWAFSGSAVVDRSNTAGFKSGDRDPLILAYTSTGRGECLAVSTDGAATFREPPGNPVVRHRGRDPKIIWHAPSQRWVMAVYNEDDRAQRIDFHVSRNLKDWEFTSRVDGFYECPELFELPVEGDKDDRRWVLYGADGGYLLGQFDGRSFRAAGPKIPFSHGNCFYASQTYSDVPREDGRRIQIAWGRIDFPGMPFNQQMLFPVTLDLERTPEGPRLAAWPVAEIDALVASKASWGRRTLAAGAHAVEGIDAELLDCRFAFAAPAEGTVSLVVRGVPIIWDASRGEAMCGKHRAPLPAIDGVVSLRVLVDRASVEIFGNQGRLYMPIGVILDTRHRDVKVLVKGCTADVQELEVRVLRSAWHTKK